MKPKYIFLSDKNNNKNYSFSSLLHYLEEEKRNDVINRFLTNRNIESYSSSKKNNDNNNANRRITININKEKNNSETHRNSNLIIKSNNTFNKIIQNIGLKPNIIPNVKTHKFRLSIVEMNEENSKKEKILLTEPNKKKKNINIHLTEEENNYPFKNNKIIYNFYSDYMRRKKQKELIESKLFKQKLISQFIKYSPNYMKKIVAKLESDVHKEIENLEKIKKENKLKVYNAFTEKIKRRLIEGDYVYENENSNIFINSIYNYLYKNIMNYDNLIYLLNKYKTKISSNFGKMISEFLSLRFDCFKSIKNTFGGPLKLIKLCEFLKLEKFKKGEVVYDIDTYENKYFLLLKGNIEVYQRSFIKEKMKIGDFINYLKDIKYKENNCFKLNRIIQKNIKRKTFDKFEILEEYEYNILSIKSYLDISEEKELFIEIVNKVGWKNQGDNINNKYTDESNSINKKIFIPKYISLEFVNEFFKDENNKKYFQLNYSDKKYICSEECILVSIEKEVLEKKNQELDIKLFGESGEMFSLYTFIFNTWESLLINSFIKKYSSKRNLIQGEYLYNQNDKSEKIYIILKGVFTQSISLNSKRITEVKKYISFNNKNNIFIQNDNSLKKFIFKEEIEKYFISAEKENGNFPFETKSKKSEIKNEDKKNNVIHTINKYNYKIYIKKNKEENEINDINNFKIKKCYKFEVLGMEEAIEGKHRFSNVKCESKNGEILEIKIIDFIHFCIFRNINITYLKEVITKLKDILIEKIEKIIQFFYNKKNLIKNYNDFNFPNEDKQNNENEIKNKLNFAINKTVDNKNYFEESVFDPLEITLHNLRKYKKNKLKEKYDIINSTSRNLNQNVNRSYNKYNFDNLFFGYFDDDYVKTEGNNEINNLYLDSKEKETNKTIDNKKISQNNTIKMFKVNNFPKYKFDLKTKSTHNLKKKNFLDNLRIKNNSSSIKKNNNIKDIERKIIRKKYLAAKKKLEESYFRREKFYYMKNFRNFPFIKYIYGKKKNINNEQFLYSKGNKDLEKEEDLNNFLKQLNSGNKNILFSKNIIKEAGYSIKNNSYKKIKINIRNNKDNNNKISSYCKTDYRTNNNNYYDLDVCFLKHIDFGKIRNSYK